MRFTVFGLSSLLYFLGKFRVSHIEICKMKAQSMESLEKTFLPLCFKTQKPNESRHQQNMNITVQYINV